MVEQPDLADYAPDPTREVPADLRVEAAGLRVGSETRPGP